MKTSSKKLKGWIEERAESFDSIEDADLSALMERIGDARVVLIGEASHGTSEFYRMRQRITSKLIRQKGFRMIGIEGDWPDVEHVDEYVRGREPKTDRVRDAFSRFPSWMWRNEEVLAYIDWLKSYNERIDEAEERVSLHGLDLYSLYTSINEVMDFFERKGDQEALELARHRYGTLLSYEPEPQDYGRAVHFGVEQDQQNEVVAMLHSIFNQRMQAASEQQDRLFDPEQNARVAANGEEYYRRIFEGRNDSWNLRDSHMFETMQALLGLKQGQNAKIVIWAHNSHVGDARATEMGRRGEHNIGQLARKAYGNKAYAIGFGSHTGTVAAADDWGLPVRHMEVNESQPGSHEYCCHRCGPPQFLLPLRSARQADLQFDILLERAIGVIYRPDSELASHYFNARLEAQFDEYIWFDRSDAVHPLEAAHAPDFPERHPFLRID